MPKANSYGAITTLTTSHKILAFTASAGSDATMTAESLKKDVGRYQVASGAATSTGWHRIAQTDTGGVADGDNFVIKIFDQSGYSKTAEIAIRPYSSARTRYNTTCKITADAFIAGNYNAFIPNIRIVKSDSSSTAGFTVEAYIGSTSTYSVEIYRAAPRISTLNGIYPIAPDPTYAGKLPDNSTTGTYLMAGERKDIYGIPTAISCPSYIGAVKITNDQIRLSMEWNELPAYGTTVTIAVDTSLKFFGVVSGATSAVLGTHTISSLAIRKYSVAFNINQTGIGTGLTNSEPCIPQIVGSMTFTIS